MMDIEKFLKNVKGLGDLLPIVIGYAWTLILFFLNFLLMYTVATALHTAVPNSSFYQWFTPGFVASVCGIVAPQLRALDGKPSWSMMEILSATFMLAMAVALQSYLLYKIAYVGDMTNDVREITMLNSGLGIAIDLLIGITSKAEGLNLSSFMDTAKNKTTKEDSAKTKTNESSKSSSSSSSSEKPKTVSPPK